jgi:hypothetical protein
VHTMITLRRPGFPALQLQLTPPHSQPYIVKLSSKGPTGWASCQRWATWSPLHVRAGSGPHSDAAQTEEVTTTNIRHEGDSRSRRYPIEHHS